jgi:hypothetical protein
MVYLVFVPHLAGIFFYATKNDFNLDQLIKGEGGERYFYAGLAAVGMITIANLAIGGLSRGARRASICFPVR